MNSISRNIILDLLPVYIAGEASRESQDLIEAFAKNDSEIAALIKSGRLEDFEAPESVNLSDDLEFKTIERVRAQVRRHMAYVAMITAVLLMIPWVAMQFTQEVNWTAFDFIVMGGLIASAGGAYVLISKLSKKGTYKLATALAILSVFLLTWSNLAVGIMGAESNPANLLYIAVYAVGIFGAVITRFKPGGMFRTLLATAITQLLVPLMAFLIWGASAVSSNNLVSVVLINSFFAMMFLASSILYRRASR